MSTATLAFANLCLVTVTGGIAEAATSGDVVVEIFDFDNYRTDPAQEASCDARFADLAIPLGIPCIVRPDEPALSPDTARVLVVVDGGVAETYSSGDVDIEVWDFDNQESDPDPEGGVGGEFAELAEKMGVPYEQC